MTFKPCMRVITGIAAASLLLSGCVANPGPPPVVDEGDVAALEEQGQGQGESSTTPAPEEAENSPTQRTTVSVGVDPLRAGLNPHLVANNSELVEQIAALVLPSTFRNGQMDTDVLEVAEEVTPPAGVAQRVRYTISSAAQWSDGTPLTGADFSYLWQQMISTSGVDSPSGYHAISAINSTSGGRVVTVDFSTEVKDWRLLFNNLVPSHLLQSGDTTFVSGLASSIPASAGRYLVESVDLARGIITLNRNDRFWGENPAAIDVIQLRNVRDTSQAVNMLRTGQVGFADFTPQETTLESLSLLPKVDAENIEPARQLRLHLSTAGKALDDLEVRRELAGLIDTTQVARLATGRTADLRVGKNPVSPPDGVAALRERAQETPIRFGVDPTDQVALTAANTIADVLAQQSIPAEVVSERLTTITASLLPAGEIDAVFTWEDTDLNSFTLANLFLCTSDQAVEEDPVSATAKPNDNGGLGASNDGGPSIINDTEIPLAGDLSGYCPQDSQSVRERILNGSMSREDALDLVRGINRRNALYVPIMDETRVHAVGEGIIGPGQDVSDWSAGLSEAASWRLADEPSAGQLAQPEDDPAEDNSDGDSN